MALMPVSSSEILLGKERVRYFRMGSGPPLVLLHGLGGSPLVWHRNFEELSAHYTVIAPDFWGPGRNTDRSQPAMRSGFDFLIRFLDGLAIERAHIVGSSLGGLFATLAGIERPERVLSITLVDSAGFGREIAWTDRIFTLPWLGDFLFRPRVSGMRKMMRMLLADHRLASDELVQALYEERLQPGVPGQMLAALRAGVGLRGVKEEIQLLPRASEVQVPTLVMWGAEDPLFPPIQAHRAANAIPGARLKLFEHSGHWPYLERSSEFNQELYTFLRSVDGYERSADGHGSAQPG